MNEEETAIMLKLEKFDLPVEGEKIEIQDGKLLVPNHPVIPFIEGDGTGRDIWRASKRVLDAAVEKAYGGKKKIAWYEVFAGEKAFNTYGEWLPADTLTAIREYIVAIKGPLTTPIGGGDSLAERGASPGVGSVRMPASGSLL